MNIFSNNLAKILKGILRWEVIGGITSLIALLFAYSQFKHDRGGELTAYLNDEIAYNEDVTNLAIFVENPNIDISNAISITPTLGNNSEYSIRDFSLQYHISTHGIDVIPSDYYDIYKEKDGLTLKYKGNTLYAFTLAESPIKRIYCNQDIGTLDIVIKASYDGISKPFTHKVAGNIHVIPKHPNLNEWKDVCNLKLMQNNQPSKIYAYYLYESQFYSDLIFPAAHKPQSHKNESNKTQREDKELTENITAATNSQPSPTTIDYSDPLKNLPISIRDIKISRLEDGTSKVLIEHLPFETDRDICFAFNYIYKRDKELGGGHARSKKRTIAHKNIRKGTTVTDIYLPREYEDVKFIGIATEDPSLSDYLSLSYSEYLHVRNKAKFPIGYNHKYKIDGVTHEGYTVVQSKSSVSHHLGQNYSNPSFRFYRLPIDDQRTTKWQRAFHNLDNKPTPLSYVGAVILGMFGSGIFILICEYYEYHESYKKNRNFIKEVKEALLMLCILLFFLLLFVIKFIIA